MGKLPKLLLIVCFCLCTKAFAQKPTIVSIDRVDGGFGDIVTLKGSDFGTDPTKLKISFGGAIAQIQEVSDQLIQVRTPAGTTYDNISITNITNGLTGYSAAQFLLKFNGDHGLTSANFGAEALFNAESGLYDLCMCDFNGDDKVDVATASTNTNSLAIFQNGSTVANINLIRANVLVNAKSLHAACGDLNGDGKPDMVVSEYDGDRLFIFRNAGSFTFNIQSIRLTGRKVKRLAIGDLDLNGKPEIVVTDTDQTRNSFTILPNQSTLTNIAFGSPVNVVIPGGAISNTDALEIKDLNGNGLPEIITAQFNAVSDIYICDNKSTSGNFNFSDIITVPFRNTASNIRIGDLDGDGKLDIVATKLLGSDISIFRNQSTATQISFDAPISIFTANRPTGIDMGDLDGDGKADIVVASIGNKSLSIFNNKSTAGSISFEPMLALPTNFINRHVKIGDIDGDGKPDIVFASVDDNNSGGVPSSKISVFRNQSCFIPALDPKGPLAICSGFPLKLNSTISTGISYDWKKDGSSVGTGPNSFLNISASGNYTVTATAEGGACVKTSNAVSVTVSAPGAGLNANPPDASSNSPVCVNNNLILQVNDVGATEYRWRGPNGITATGRTPTINNFTLDNAGLYIVEMIAGTCVAKIDSTLVAGISNPNFTVTFSGSDLVCQGSTKTLNVSPLMTSGFTYQWAEKTSGNLTGQTNNTLGVTTSGEYLAKVISIHPGCSPTETPAVKITAVAPPDASFTLPVKGCVGQEIKFTNQSTFDPLATPSYAWSFGNNTTASELTPKHTYTQAGIYQVKLKVIYQGDACTNEETKSISIISAPAITIKNPLNKSKLCPDDTLKLVVSGDVFSTYLWSTGETTPSIIIDEAKEYTVDVTNPSGCVLHGVKTITPFQRPVVTASAIPQKIKVGDETQLSATGLESYTWRPGISVKDSTEANTLAKPLQNITYTVFGFDINGCRGEASVEVVVTGSSALNLILPKNYFSPNGDTENPEWVVDNIESFPQCGVSIFNDKGAKIFEAKPYTNNWDGTYKGAQLPGGVYYYVIRCDGDSKVKTGSITLLK